MTTVGFTTEWLALREQADADARAAELLNPLRDVLSDRSPIVVRDLGCGTGSMARWLARRWDRPQHWVLQDRDPELLTVAGTSVTGPNITTETRAGDLTALRADDLTGTSLVTASALLDLLAAEEVQQLARVCVEARCPALLTLTVAGRVELDPPEQLDAAFEAAFNAHQRRTTGDRRPLGPDAVPVAVNAFQDLGAEVFTRPSPWRLGPEEAELTEQWLRGWVEAACERQPELAAQAPDYLQRRLAGELRVVVHHTDLLAIPRAAP